MSSFYYLFILFIIYSFIGYIAEVIYCSIESKKIVLNRGFFLGPYLPIYGICCVIMILFLEKYNNDIITLFVMSLVVCSIIEYLTSFILEKIFKVRWWDYSHMKFNIEGRVCLLNSALFGLGGVALVRFINPCVSYFINLLSDKGLMITAIVLIIVFISDLVVTVYTLGKIKISSNNYTDHDATEEIKQLVRKKLEKSSFLVTHLLNAFPKMSGKNLSIIIEFKKRTNEFRKKLKENRIRLKR